MCSIVSYTPGSNSFTMTSANIFYMCVCVWYAICAGEIIQDVDFSVSVRINIGRRHFVCNNKNCAYNTVKPNKYKIQSQLKSYGKQKSIRLTNEIGKTINFIIIYTYTQASARTRAHIHACSVLSR